MFDPPISHPLFYVCLSVISYFLHNVSYFARHRVNVVEPRRESEPLMTHRRASGWILNQDSLRTLRENMLWYPLSFIICNTKPIGHQVLKMLEKCT